MKTTKCFVLMLTLLILLSSAANAANPEGNALAAVALYIDTSGSYVPGMELLNRALNEIIRYKINVLFLGSEVQSGNEVLRELRRCNVNTAADATPEALSAYAGARHVNYVILFSVRPLDVAIDLKAYSAASGNYIIDKSITRPSGSEALSTVDALSGMLGDEVTAVFETIRSAVPLTQ